MKLALLEGGMGHEAEVSRATAKAFAAALQSLNYNFVRIEADENLLSKLQQEKPDRVLLALHGKYAEDGTVQGICEYLKIPYSGSGVLASALAMDKLRCKEVLSFYGIDTPAFAVYHRDLQKLEDFRSSVSAPCVVKPVREGSSVGISMVEAETDLLPAIALAAKFDRRVLIEEKMTGAECTVPILNGKALCPIEIRPKQGFYDYKNKYTKGATDYLLPPQLSSEKIDEVKALAERIFKILDLHFYGRIDFIFHQGKPYFIEANSLPGCTETSLLPKSAAYEGIAFPDLVAALVANARLDYDEPS